MKIKEYIDNKINKVLNEKYKAYKGSTGPSDENVKQNDEYLMRQLRKYGITNFKYINNPDIDDTMVIRFTDGVDVAYDRWGYVTDNTNDDGLDQASFDDTIKYLKKRYKK